MTDDPYPGLVEWPILMPDGRTSTLLLPSELSPPPGYGIELTEIEGRPGVCNVMLVKVSQ
jgi:hypothetical protein